MKSSSIKIALLITTVVALSGCSERFGHTGGNLMLATPITTPTAYLNQVRYPSPMQTNIPSTLPSGVLEYAKTK